MVDALNVEAVTQALLRYMTENPDDVHPFAREMVERAQVRHVINNMKRVLQMPDDELAGELPSPECVTVDATAVRVD